MTNEKFNYDGIPNSESDLDTEARKFVDWREANRHQYTFEDNEVRTGTNKYNRSAYYYNVEEAGVKKVLSVTSMKAMIQLKNLRPLEGKTVSHTRSGEGYTTEHKIIVI